MNLTRTRPCRLLQRWAIVACFTTALTSGLALGQAPRGVFLYSWDIALNDDVPKKPCPNTPSLCNDAQNLLSALSVDGVDGFTLVEDWSAIEPTMGTYSFGRMDGWIQAAESAGKSVNLAIRAGGGATGTATPCWLFASGCAGYTGQYAGATPFSFEAAAHQGQLNNCVQMTIAAPWDQVFQAQWKKMLARLASHLQSTVLSDGQTEWQAVSMVRLTGINRTTDEFRLPEQQPETLASCGPNPIDAIQQWLHPPPNTVSAYDPELLLSGWTAIVDTFSATFPGKYVNLPIIPNNTGSGLGSGDPQNPFPEIDNVGHIYDPPVNPAELSPVPPPAHRDPNFALDDQNAPLIDYASQVFGDLFSIEFESLNTASPANPYVVQQAQALNSGNTGAAFMTNNWLGGQSSASGAVCKGGPGTGTACVTEQQYFQLLLQGIYLPTATSNPRFRSQFLEVFFPDVLRGPAYACAIWKAHVDLTDYTAPVTTASITGNLQNGNYVGAVTIHLQAADASTSGGPVGCEPFTIATQFRKDSGPWTSGARLTFVTPGVHTLRYRSTDVAGNQEAIQTLNLVLLP